MAKNNQTQEAGNQSTQIQATNVNLYTGISEQRAREICEEQYLAVKRELTEEALQIANERVLKLEERTITRFSEIDGALESFADPSFQLLLTEAQKTAAKTNREEDYDLLAELLVHRVNNASDRSKCTGISKAVEIVDQITDEALQALTIVHAVSTYLPISGDPHEGITILGQLYDSLLYEELPNNKDWLDHLDILGTVRVSSFIGMKKLGEFFQRVLMGILLVGLKKVPRNIQLL